MNLNTLRYIVAVADCHSISLAAKAMFVSQPTISQNILSTEKQLGVKLFDRSTIPLLLTPEGHLFVDWARNTLLTQAQMRRQLSAQASSERTRLSIGIAPHRSAMLLPDILQQISGEFPKCFFSIKTALVAELYNALDDQDLDIIVSDAPEDPQKYNCIRLRSEHIMLAVSKSFGIKAESSGKNGGFSSISIQSVAHLPFIGYESHTYLGNCMRMLAELENFTPQVSVEVSRVDLAISLVARGMGVTLIPEFSVTFADNPMNLDYFYINRFAPTRILTIAHRKNHPLSMPGQRFVQLFSEYYAPTAEEAGAER